MESHIETVAERLRAGDMAGASEALALHVAESLIVDAIRDVIAERPEPAAGTGGTPGANFRSTSEADKP